MAVNWMQVTPCQMRRSLMVIGVHSSFGAVMSHDPAGQVHSSELPGAVRSGSCPDYRIRHVDGDHSTDSAIRGGAQNPLFHFHCVHEREPQCGKGPIQFRLIPLCSSHAHNQDVRRSKEILYRNP